MTTGKSESAQEILDRKRRQRDAERREYLDSFGEDGQEERYDGREERFMRAVSYRE